MLRDGMTIREATEAWVNEMNAIPQGVIEKMMRDNPDEWEELTTPARGDRVYVYKVEGDEHEGVIENELESTIGDCNPAYEIRLDDSNKIIARELDFFDVEREDLLPMWGTMWTFGDSADDYWLEELGGIKVMSECGFRVYENKELGYVFGIDGAGYDFFEAHWVPLYKKRGLKWHDERTERGSFFMTESRKAELYKPLLDCLRTLVEDTATTVGWLKEAGFTDEEIAYEGFEVIDDEG